METLAIVLLTAKTHEDRERYAVATLRAVLERLESNMCDIHVHIADDGSGTAYQNMLMRLADEYGYHASITDSGRTGYGANYNLALKLIHSAGFEYVLPLEDDWELTRVFNIDPIIDVLKHRVFDSVRMGYIGYTQRLIAELVWCNNEHWLHLLPESEEPHVFSGHPRIETVAYEQRVGPWPEGLSPGETEWHVATQLGSESRKGVGYPLWAAGDLKNGLFAHIGTVKSY